MSAWRYADGSVRFVERRGADAPLLLACGQCVGCRLRKSVEWAIRCVHEAQMHERNSFITLTYSDENLPPNCDLRYRDFQLFAKRLRRKVGPFRFYMCGEYGERFWRPHFHACIFGLDFDDRAPYSRRGGHQLYTSKVLTETWGLGVEECQLIGSLDFESAAYVARYMVVDEVKVVIDDEGRVHQRVAPFTRMSNRAGGNGKPGGIGASWFERFSADVYPEGEVVLRGGRRAVAPRYYDKLQAKVSPESVAEVKEIRAWQGYQRRADSTDERLAVREAVAKARVRLFQKEL